MNSGARMKDLIGMSNNVVMALDDSEMDNDNENGAASGGASATTGVPGSLGGSSSLTSSGAAAHYQTWSTWHSSANPFGGGPGSSRELNSTPSFVEFEIDNSSIDLDTYVTGYTGVMRINRLLFVAEHCPSLRIDALRMALNFVMETFNVQLYNVIHKQLTDAFAKL